MTKSTINTVAVGRPVTGAAKDMPYEGHSTII